jgi:hypothetical protein
MPQIMNFVHFTGPESVIDKREGWEAPEWSVFVADLEGHKRRSKIYRVRDFGRAAALAELMAADRGLRILDHADVA